MKKIVLTGGPSSGKSSTVAALKTLDTGSCLVPEAATLLLSGGFPVPNLDDVIQVRTFQRLIFEVQHSLEKMVALGSPGAKAMILDRGTLDGVAYWPEGSDAFLRDFNIGEQEELARYDHVVYFESPPKAMFGGANPARIHDYDQGCGISEKQHAIWSRHPSFFSIPYQQSLTDKVARAVGLLQELISG